LVDWDINQQGLGYANKTICRKTLENGAGADCHLRRNAATPLGGNDLGLGRRQVIRRDVKDRRQ
jgi:hypothetical protein